MLPKLINCSNNFLCLQCKLQRCSLDSEEHEGVQTRLVFCGAIKDDFTVVKADEKNCEEEKKYDNVQNCTLTNVTECQKEGGTGVWFTGPWSQVIVSLID